MSNAIEAPPLWMMALESRAPLERAAMALASPFRRLLPQGDGHHVIVLPGFTADDRSTRPLRELLDSIGYQSHGWDLGANLGPTETVLAGIVTLLENVHTQSQKDELGTVSIIGWSLGGLYARELARVVPEQIRQVITLGTPIQMVEEDSSSAQGLWDALKHLHDPSFKRETRAAHRPLLDVPATSIYSRTDGVVHWHMSLIRETDRSENIRVYGSHCGLGFNNSAIFAMADRLAQPASDWEPFKAPLLLRAHYPRSHGFDFDRLPLIA